MSSLPCISIPQSFNVQGHAIVYLQVFTSLSVLDVEYNEKLPKSNILS